MLEYRAEFQILNNSVKIADNISGGAAEVITEKRTDRGLSSAVHRSADGLELAVTGGGSGFLNEVLGDD